MKRPILVLLLVIIIFLSGCTFFTSTPSDSQDSGSDDGLSDGVDYPPGVTPDGLEDIDRLSSSHAFHLSDSPYTLELSHSVSFTQDAGTISRKDINISVNETGYLYTYSHEDARTDTHFETTRFSVAQTRNPTSDEQSRVHIKHVNHQSPSTTEYLTRLRTPNETEDMVRSSSNLLRNFLGPGSTVSSPFTQDGRKMFWITVDTAPSSLESSDVENYRAIALVDSSGFVHELYVDFDTVLSENGRLVHHSLVLNYSLESELSIPGWTGRKTIQRPDSPSEIQVIREISRSRLADIPSSVSPSTPSLLDYIHSSRRILVDPFKLGRSHILGLRKANSFTYVEKTTRSVDNNLLSERLKRIAVEGNESFVRVEDRMLNAAGDETSDTLEIWSNLSLRVTSETTPNETTYSQGYPRETDTYVDDSSDLISTSYTKTSTHVFGPVEHDSRRGYWVMTTNKSFNYQDARNYLAVGFISDSVFYDFSFEYDTFTDVGLLHNQISFEVTEVGNTDVEKPEWFDTAIGNSESPLSLPPVEEQSQALDITAQVVNASRISGVGMINATTGDFIKPNGTRLNISTRNLTEVDKFRGLLDEAINMSTGTDELQRATIYAVPSGNYLEKLRKAFNNYPTYRSNTFYKSYFVHYRNRVILVRLYQPIKGG